MPTQGGRIVPEPVLYAENDISLKGNDKIKELEVWNVGNPYYDITGDVNDRKREISTQKFDRMNISDLIPAGGNEGDGRFSHVLNPLDDVANNTKNLLCNK